MSEAKPPDRLRPLIYGTAAALGAAALWGVQSVYSGVFHNWLALPLGLIVGTIVGYSERRVRGPGLMAFAALLTALGWFVALYIAAFGVFLVEVSEHQGHMAANQVPVTVMFTAKFCHHFWLELPASLPWDRLSYLAGALVISALLARRR